MSMIIAMKTMRRSWRRRLAWRLAAVCILFLAGLMPSVRAATCTASAVGVSFGSYDVFSNQPLDSTGSVSVSCDTSASYTIALGPGSGTFSVRTMTSGTHPLDYNLYTDATHASIWGDGSSGTSTVAGSGTSGSYTVYGEIPARQNAYVGSYSDTITVTVTY